MTLERPHPRYQPQTVTARKVLPANLARLVNDDLLSEMVAELHREARRNGRRIVGHVDTDTWKRHLDIVIEVRAFAVRKGDGSAYSTVSPNRWLHRIRAEVSWWRINVASVAPSRALLHSGLDVQPPMFMVSDQTFEDIVAEFDGQLEWSDSRRHGAGVMVMGAELRRADRLADDEFWLVSGWNRANLDDDSRRGYLAPEDLNAAQAEAYQVFRTDGLCQEDALYAAKVLSSVQQGR